MRVLNLSILSFLLVISQLGYSQEKIDALLEDRVSIYPNPISDGILNLEIIDNNLGTLVIYDFLGKQVFNVNLDIPAVHKYRFYLSELPRGKYFVKINIDNEVITKKVSIL